MTGCAPIPCAVCPALRDVLSEVPFAITTESEAPSTSMATMTYGKPELPVLHVTADVQYQLGLLHTTVNSLVALIRDFHGHSCIRSAKSQFDTFKAASYIAMVHVPYP